MKDLREIKKKKNGMAIAEQWVFVDADRNRLKTIQQDSPASEKSTEEAVHPSLVVWSSRLPSTIEMPDTQTRYARHHHLALFYRSWRIWGSLLVPCRKDMR